MTVTQPSGETAPRIVTAPQTGVWGAERRGLSTGIHGRTLSPLRRQRRGTDAVVSTHLPVGRQPGSREPVVPACTPIPPSTGIPVLGFNWDSVASELPRDSPWGRGRGRRHSSTHHQRLLLPPAPSHKHKTGREGGTLRAQSGSKRAEKIWRWMAPGHSQASQHLVLIKHFWVRNKELLVSVEGVQGTKATQTQRNRVTGSRVWSN